jgi:hypothetical protein
MPMLGIMASQISGHLWAPSGAYDSIATVSVGSGGAASATFTSIPSTYSHLQIRAISRSDRATGGGTALQVQFNSDTASNYWQYHFIYGTGAGVGSLTGNLTTQALIGFSAGDSSTAGIFETQVVDILDYANTNKYKVIRSLAGGDYNNTNGQIELVSANWNSTAAINSITIFNSTYNFKQYTQFALYGVK